MATTGPWTTPSQGAAPSGAASSGGVFSPAAQTAAIAAPSSTYDPFGLPAGMGDQRIYVGYLPQETYGSKSTKRGPNGDLPIPTVAGPIADQTVSVQDLIKHFHDMATSGNQYTRTLWAQTQMQLQAMNAYGASSRINYGAWSDDDNGALAKALTGYLQGGDVSKLQTFEEYLSQQAAQGAANGLDGNQKGGPGGSQRAPLQLTNDADLNQAGDNVSQQFLGHAMNSGQQSQFSGQYHGDEQAAYDAAAGSNDYQAPASAADAARQFVLQNNLPEYASHQAESFMNVFANMFLSGQSTRANTTLGDAAVGG